MGCNHTVIFEGKLVTAWTRMRDSNLTRKSSYLFRCGECGLLKVQQAISEDTPLGPKIRIKTYYPRNEVTKEPVSEDEPKNDA